MPSNLAPVDYLLGYMLLPLALYVACRSEVAFTYVVVCVQAIKYDLTKDSFLVISICHPFLVHSGASAKGGHNALAMSHT